MRHQFLLLSTAALLLTACGNAQEAAQGAAAETKAVVADIVTEADVKAAPAQTLTQILNGQPAETKARYQYRHPKETLEFFGIEPGMTVAEALPGGGWYSKILLPYLGDDGALIGVDYSLAMWPEFGGFATPEFIEGKKTWPQTWTKDAAKWRAGSEADISAFAFGQRPEDVDGQVDAVLFIRALHNMARFEDEGSYLTDALADTHAMLKPGGIVGVVQHRAPVDSDAKWADGNQGYLKEADVIAFMQKAGFKLTAQDEINANPKDKPTSDDIVWRLPPSLGTSNDNPELEAKMKAIGESDRMTLKFVKE